MFARRVIAGIKADMFFTIPKPISLDLLFTDLNLFISEFIEFKTLISAEPTIVSFITEFIFSRFSCPSLKSFVSVPNVLNDYFLPLKIRKSIKDMFVNYKKNNENKTKNSTPFDQTSLFPHFWSSFLRILALFFRLLAL
jgi:hypothetical protein